MKRHAFACAVHDAEVELGGGKVLPSGPAIPADGLGVVPRHALAGVVHDAEVELGVGNPLLGGHAIPTVGLGVVLWHALAVSYMTTSYVRPRGQPLRQIGVTSNLPRRTGLACSNIGSCPTMVPHDETGRRPCD